MKTIMFLVVLVAVAGIAIAGTEPADNLPKVIVPTSVGGIFRVHNTMPNKAKEIILNKSTVQGTLPHVIRPGDR